MFTEALIYFVTAFFVVAGLSIALAATGVAMLVRDRRAQRATVTALPTLGTAVGQEAA
jgi:hypothetical protein